MISACGNGTGSAGSEAETQSEAASTSAPAMEQNSPEEERAASAESVPDNATSAPDELFVDVALPLVEERETLSMWWGGYDGGNFGNDNPGVTLMSQAAIEATNVEIDYRFCSGMDFIDQTSLVFASGDWPDMFRCASMYSGGLSAGVEENVFLNLADYDLEQNSPNYYARITSNDDLYKQVSTDEGYLAKYYTIYDEPLRQNTGLLVRTDYLDQLGLSLPETYDDWHTMLQGFKNDLGLAEPFILDTSGLLDMLIAGYGVNSSWYQIDGQVYYAPVQEGFREYLTMVNQWDAEGLIHQDFMNNTVSDERLNKIYNGTCGAYVDEMVLKFITGAESLDGFDDYAATIEAMGLPKAIALKQDGLDRYNAS